MLMIKSIGPTAVIFMSLFGFIEPCGFSSWSASILSLISWVMSMPERWFVHFLFIFDT